MKHFKNFILYTPDEEKKITIPGYNAYYIKDSNGVDWYDAQHQFFDSSLKVLYDKNGMIRAAATGAVDAYFPVNMSVIELKASDENKAVKADGTWFYRNGKLQQIIDYAAIATKQRDSLASDAAKTIAPLQDAADVDLATKEELQKLKEWKIYRVMLSRLDLSTAPDVDWPEKPKE